MGFSEKVKVRLWGTANARCCLCKQECIEEAKPNDDPSNVGECAHIVGEKDTAARHDMTWSAAEIDAESNGLLLCNRCHKIVDDQPNEYTVQRLTDIREAHRTWLQYLVRKSLDGRRLERTLVLHSKDFQIAENLAVHALTPDYPAIPTRELRVDPASDGWDAAATQQEAFVASMRQAPTPDCYAVFSLADIPLCVHLGTLLGNRCPVSLFQYDRHCHDWAWPELPADTEVDKDLILERLPDEARTEPSPVVVRVSLSALVGTEDCEAHVPNGSPDIHLRVGQPSPQWLVSAEQLEVFGRAFQGVLDSVAQHCDVVHLFAAVPCGAAIQMGRQWNPKMHPPLVLYEYDRTGTSRYAAVLQIE